MTNKKSTKRALIFSVLSLVLCFSMLVGTTFAWFTDSVTSANNIIQSGNLDITLEYYDGQWKDVKNSAEILDKEALWEPGYTEVVYFRIKNNGSLALKYSFGVNIVDEKGGVNAAGKDFKLSDYIYFDMFEGVNGETAPFANREAAMANTTEKTLISEGYAKAGTLAAGSDYVYLAMVVYMPETVGNEANHAKGEEPKIELGINIVATQVESEQDSFGDDYDANAPFSIWDGTVPTEMPASLVVDGATQTVHVKDAAAFAYLSTLSAKWVELYTDGNGRDFPNYANGAGGDYYYSDQWTVSLEADIDLNNHSIAPVDIKLGESTGASAFNGNGHTIRNINTTTGLFADQTRASFSNLTLLNVKATNGALIGFARDGITNVTVKNATISGTDYVGGLVGSAYSSVTGCKVIDSSITATGKEAGAMIGYIETSTTATVAYNTVNNVNVYAGNRAAGLVAQVNVNVKVYNNVIDTITVGAADTTTYQPGAVVSNALAPANVYDNTVNGATIIGITFADNSNLGAAIAGDKNVILSGDVQYGSKIENDATINLSGKTFEAMGTLELKNNSDLTMTGGNYEVNGTNGHVDVRPSTAEGSVVIFEDVDFSFNKLDPTYGPSTNRLGTVVEVCATAADAKTVIVFKNCTFDNAQVLFEGMSGKTGEFEATFENCTFNALTSSAPIYVQNYVKGIITVKNCTFNLECTSSTASAISVSPSSSTTVTVIAENNTINAVAATPYTHDAAAGETNVYDVKVNGTPANIKFISAYENTTVNEIGTVKSGIVK